MRYTVLGRISASGADEDAIRLGGPQQRRLLAVLLSQRGQPVSPDRLIDSLWPDGLSAPGATRSVHTYVSRLRRAVGDSAIVTDGASYSVSLPSGSLDAEAFEDLLAAAGSAPAEQAVEHLDRALALWGGPAYGEFGGEWWAISDAARLHELRNVAIEERGAALLELGRSVLAVPDLEALAMEEPLRERPVELLMRALDGSGRQADALRAFQQFRAHLAEQTGLEPSSALSATEQAIASGASRASGVARQIGRPVNPYKGLRAFTEPDAPDFFGRDGLARDVAAAVDRLPLVAVVGPSGSGKSSLVSAGLIPLLRRRPDATIVALVPRDRPLAALREAVRSAGLDPTELDRPAGSLGRLAAAANGGLIVVVDQFEESWLVADVDERAAFLAVLASATARRTAGSAPPPGSARWVRAGSPSVHVVVAIRADLYDRPLQDPGIGRAVADGTVAIPALTASELGEVIVCPAARQGVTFEDGVVVSLIAELTHAPGALPFLQFALAELFDRRTGTTVTAAALADLGGAGGAIGRRAEDLYGALTPAQQAQARWLFGRLVEPGEGGPDTRRRARAQELPAAARDVVDEFVSARLLVADRDPASGEVVVEVAHEALLDAWPRLRGWIDDDRLWLIQAHHLAAAARVWDEADRPVDELYAGGRLQGILDATPERRALLSPVELEFVAASTVARDRVVDRERRGARRTRRLLGVVAALLVVAVIAASVAASQRRDARSAARTARSAGTAAQVEALAGRVRAMRSSQRDVAALLAVEAHRLADTPRTRSALFGTFTDDPGFLGYRRLDGRSGTTQGALLPDGTAVVTDEDQRLHVVDLEDGSVGVPWDRMPGELAGYSRVRASVDGRLVAQVADLAPAGDRSSVGVYDAARGRLVTTVDPDGYVGDVLFSADGRTLYATVGPVGDLVAFSVEDGARTAELDGLAPAEGSAPEPVFIDGNPCVLARRGPLPDPTVIGGVAGIAASTGGLIAVGSPAGPIRFVDPVTLAPTRQVDGPPGASTHLISFDGGEGLVSYGVAGLRRLDASSGAPQWSVKADFIASPCDTAAISPTSGSVFYANQFGGLQERDLQTGTLRRDLDAQNGNTASLWISRDGAELVAFGDSEPVVARWRLDGTGPVSRRLPDGFVAFFYSPDGTRVSGTFPGAGVPEDGDPAVLDASTGEVVDDLADLVGPSVWLDDDTVAGVTIRDGVPRPERVPLDGGTPTLGAATFPGGPVSSSFVEAGKPYGWLPFAVDGRVELWRFDLRRFARIDPTISIEGYTRMASDAEATLVAVGTYRGVTVYDGATGRELGAIADPNLRAVHITPDDQLVVSTLGGELRVYDLDTLELERTLGGNLGMAQELWSDRRSTVLVTRSGSGDVAVFDLASGERIGSTLEVADDESNGVALRSDGRELLFGGGSRLGSVIWDLDPDHWKAAACRLAGRNLTRAEWASNIGDLAPYRRTCPALDHPPG